MMKINSDYTKQYHFNNIAKLARRVIGNPASERIEIETPELGDYARILAYADEKQLRVSKIRQQAANFCVTINIGITL